MGCLAPSGFHTRMSCIVWQAWIAEVEGRFANLLFDVKQWRCHLFVARGLYVTTGCVSLSVLVAVCRGHWWSDGIGFNKYIVFYFYSSFDP